MGCSALMVLLPAADREVIVRRKTVRVRTDKTGWDTFARLFMVQFTNNEGPDECAPDWRWTTTPEMFQSANRCSPNRLTLEL